MDNPFMISDDVNAEALDEPLAHDEMAGQFAADEDEAEIEDTSPDGLIPLCVKHATGPKTNPALYGYDISMLEQQPWRQADANTSDYFNYGFNENSWRAYCAMQVQGNNALAAQGEEMMQKLKSELGGGNTVPHQGGGGGGGGMGMDAPPGMGEGHHDRPHQHRPGGEVSYYKTRLCFAFGRGQCSNTECKYAHGEQELRHREGDPNPPGGRSHQGGPGPRFDSYNRGGPPAPGPPAPPGPSDHVMPLPHQGGGPGPGLQQGGGGGGYDQPLRPNPPADMQPLLQNPSMLPPPQPPQLPPGFTGQVPPSAPGGGGFRMMPGGVQQ